MSSEYRNLPGGYTQVEYIRHNLIGYIDTGVVVSPNTSVTADFQFDEVYYGFEARIFGVYTENTKLRAGIRTDKTFVNSVNPINYSQTMNIYERTTVTASPDGSCEDYANLYIFAQRQDGSENSNVHFFSNYFIGKLYSMTISDGGTLIRDFVPVIRDQDSKPGLFDVVNNEFYIETTDIPDTYQRVEYIESTGTQYVDTGVNASGSLGFLTKLITYNALGTSGNGVIFGATDTGSPSWENAYYLETWTNNVGVNRGTFVRSNTTVRDNYDPGIDPGTLQIIGHSTVTKTLLKGDGSYTAINTSTDNISGSYSMFIFTRSITGVAVDSYTSDKLYYFAFLDSYEPIHIYIPVIQVSDSEPGLYDIVDGEFLTNEGTGDFLYGPVLEETLIPGPQVKNTNQLTVEFGLIKDYPETTIFYDGDDDSGLTVIIDTFGTATNIRIDRTTGGEYLQIDTTKFAAIVGSGIQEYDHIEINTRRGKKSASIYRNGIKYNILHAITCSKNWIHLDKGANTFTFAAETGVNNLRVYISYVERFNGV